jgi:hypothetical protein
MHYVHGKSWYQCLVSLSLSPRNQNDRWIVSECVSMSICEDTISNLSRPFSVCVCVCVCDVCINTYV